MRAVSRVLVAATLVALAACETAMTASTDPGTPPGQAAAPSPVTPSPVAMPPVAPPAAAPACWPADIDRRAPLLPAGTLRPATMAIGESTWSGVTSLSISEDRARLAPPAQLATALGETFRHPTYPRPILVDLQDLVNRPLEIVDVLDRVGTNLDAWQADATRPPGSRPRVFDNLSLGQSTIANLSTVEPLTGDLPDVPADIAKPRLVTWRDADAVFRWLHQRYRSAATLDAKIAILFRIWYVANARFVLNPDNAAFLEDLTPLGQVRLRQPQRLLVNIGNNDGVWEIAFRAKTIADPAGRKEFFRERMTRLATCLKQLVDETSVARIYVTSLPRPSFAANLIVDSAREGPFQPDRPCAESRFERYWPRLVLELAQAPSLSRDDMCRMDALIAEINTQTRSIMERIVGPKLVFVDLGPLLDRHDAKHFGDGRKLWLRNPGGFHEERALSNVALESGWFPGAGLLHGGLFSMDNMHPTEIAYTLVANELLSVIGRTEARPIRPIDPGAVYFARRNGHITPRNVPDYFSLAYCGLDVAVDIPQRVACKSDDPVLAAAATPPLTAARSQSSNRLVSLLRGLAAPLASSVPPGAPGL